MCIRDRAYIEEQKQLPKCLTMSLAAYIAFYSSDIQERTADGLICKRPAGNQLQNSLMKCVRKVTLTTMESWKPVGEDIPRCV